MGNFEKLKNSIDIRILFKNFRDSKNRLAEFFIFFEEFNKNLKLTMTVFTKVMSHDN